MTTLDVVPDGDDCWPDVADIHWRAGALVGVAALPGGTDDGRPSVTLRVQLRDGSVVLAETTLALFLAAGEAFVERHGDPRKEER